MESTCKSSISRPHRIDFLLFPFKGNTVVRVVYKSILYTAAKAKRINIVRYRHEFVAHHTHFGSLVYTLRRIRLGNLFGVYRLSVCIIIFVCASLVGHLLSGLHKCLFE